MKEKIIQIMPAPMGLFAEYRNEENPSNPFFNRVICLALTDRGEIHVMDIDDMGTVEKAESISNFEGIVWKENK